MRCSAGCARRAVRTLRLHGDDKQHRAFRAGQGGRRATRAVTWTGGTERAMVVGQEP